MNFTAPKTTTIAPSFRTFLSASLGAATAFVLPAAALAASAGHYVPKAKPAPTTPSATYSGGSPIDMTNGGFFNNGTFGQPNADLEKWAQSPTWAVSLSELAYSFDEKDRFVETLNERIQHFEHAVWNYSQVTEVSKPEGVAHAQKMTAELNPKIERARDAWSKAKSSGRSDWEATSNEAKKAFLDLQAFSYGLHKNVSTKR